MSDVFVSYKAEDRRRVQPLVEALQNDGYSVWWDQQIGGGTSWRRQIEAELNTAKCVIVMWSKRSVADDGEFVQDEATRAKQRRVYVPVIVDRVPLPLGFGETQALSLISWKGDAGDPRYLAVLSSVRRLAGEVRASAAQRQVRGRVSRRTVVAGGALATTAVAAAGLWTILKPTEGRATSIGVLPFENLSGDPTQRYFADGIAEELRSALTRLAGLKVAGRTSSEVVRNDDAQVAARKLGVATILLGSVRQSPSAIRVNAQLVDGRTGLERWSEIYDRSPGDSIRIQTDIAENVVRSLSAALATGAGAAFLVGGTDNPAAQNFVLQSEEAIKGSTRETTERAIQLTDNALRLDARYADAHARKAIYLTVLGDVFARDSVDLGRIRAQAMQAASAAVSLEPKLPRAHMALADLYSSQLDLAAASREYQRALQLAPGNAAFLRPYSAFVARIFSASEGLRLADKALDLDPLNPESYRSRVNALLAGRRYADAVRFAKKTQERSPGLFDAPGLLALCFLLLRKDREALQYLSQLPAQNYLRIKGEAIVLARSGDRVGAQQKLQQMQRLFGDSMSYEYAGIFAQLGDKDKAIGALERGVAFRDPGLLSIKIDGLLDPIRGDARLASIIRGMHFPAET